MIIDITQLKNNGTNKIEINELVKMDETNKANLIDLKDTFVKGYIIKDNIDEYILNVIVEGTMILPDSITLEPVEYEFSTEIEGNIDELLQEINLISKKTEFSIDIFPIIWENILMEIPIRVAKDNGDIKMEGDGWKFIKEGHESVSTNPELEKLKDLFK